MKAHLKKADCQANLDAHAKMQEFQKLMRLANSGDKEALASIQARLKMPGGQSLLRILRRGLRCQQSFINRIAGESPVIQKAVEIQLDRLRAELSGSAATPLEKLLVERVLLGWLQVHHADAVYAGTRGVILAQGDYCQRNQSRAQARYLAAIKMLVTVRKLLQPAISPLELAAKTVNETTGSGLVIRREGSKLAKGVSVQN